MVASHLMGQNSLSKTDHVQQSGWALELCFERLVPGADGVPCVEFFCKDISLHRQYTWGGEWSAVRWMEMLDRDLYSVPCSYRNSPYIRDLWVVPVVWFALTLESWVWMLVTQSGAALQCLLSSSPVLAKHLLWPKINSPVILHWATITRLSCFRLFL